jgi:hypothetical protein
VDLKSVARAVEENAMPHSADEQGESKLKPELSLSKVQLKMAVATPQTSSHTSAQEAEETPMADQLETTTSSEAPAVAETPILAKKQRKPRAKKVARNAANSGVGEPGVADAGLSQKPKRGRKAKSIASTEVAKRGPVKRGAKPAKATALAPTEPAMPAAVAAASYESADLLQLEEENHKLRKLLSEKLRTENADLRKRLNLD